MTLAVVSGMISSIPGAEPSSRMLAAATPADGAGPIGPDQYWPVPLTVSHDEAIRALNPLQHVPVVGMIYRAVTGDTIPAPLRVLGAGLIGGPMGALAAGFFGIVEAIASMKPDTSRPSVPAGMMASGGSEWGMQPVTPGTLSGGAYTTLATTVPEWLQGPTQFAGAEPGGAEPGRGAAVYQSAAADMRQRDWLERGIS